MPASSADNESWADEDKDDVVMLETGSYCIVVSEWCPSESPSHMTKPTMAREICS